MAVSPPVPAEDQSFLAQLVFRGYLARELATVVLEAAGEVPFDDALAAVTDWDEARIAFLRRTKVMQAPEIPGFKMGQLLGTGATAEVFAAQRIKDFKHVALKILRPDLAADPLASKRFLQEAKLLKDLNVPGVVCGHRAFRFIGTLILEMDKVPGKNLEDMLAEGHEFQEKEALSIVLQVAAALEGMRGQGVVHRDLKPGNVMVTKDGKVKLIDLGFAGEGMSGTAGAGTTLGTAAYLAPEQAQGREDLDGRADIYSLGATLYHLVVGALPFEAGDDQEMVRKQVLESLKGSALKGRSISPHLHYFIEKMMAKDREVRYSTPNELMEDIAAHLAR
ncbi:MAG: serine/threonine-protein kinase [Planctomycetota bacterium]|nr:serine/threonine-protein kinase [Planctomycetota bacterium]MDA1112717.1 serine/threonine-protein kinase [Planctomycetota bacterium]